MTMARRLASVELRTEGGLPRLTFPRLYRAGAEIVVSELGSRDGR